MKLDILVFAAHPDDAELACSGTIVKHIKAGKKVGVVDLTRGELGSRGSAEIRHQEAAKASEIMGLAARVNLDLGDGRFENNHESRLKLIEQIRRFQPEIVLGNAIKDRHSDHGRAAELARDACFYSGLAKIETQWQGESQAHWRPKALYHYIQDYHIEPDFVVDISEEWTTKRAAISAFSSQFFSGGVDGPATPISSEGFWHFLEARARDFGRPIGATYGEGFTSARYLGVDNLFDLS